MAAARIKALHPLAYKDAFAVATAAAHDAVLLTGDPELTSRSVGCRVEDLRRQVDPSMPARRQRSAMLDDEPRTGWQGTRLSIRGCPGDSGAGRSRPPETVEEERCCI